MSIKIKTIERLEAYLRLKPFGGEKVKSELWKDRLGRKDV